MISPWRTLLGDAVSLLLLSVLVLALGRTCAYSSTYVSIPREAGPESAAAGDQVAAQAVLQGQDEVPAECLIEGEQDPFLLVLTLTVEPEPAQRHETASTEVVGACAAPAADGEAR